MQISDLIRERGPLTVAAFMDLALYDPGFGYYARSAQRSGRAGDFFTSVDVGPLFGELLEVQLAEMCRLTAEAAKHAETSTGTASSAPSAVFSLDLIEAGAGNGRLSADILRTARQRHPEFYRSVSLHLVEASEAARIAQRDALGDVVERLASSGPALPESFEGVLIANELLDAMPVHQVVMRREGLREMYVAISQHGGGPPGGALHLVEGPLSSPALEDYLERLGVKLEPGWRVEINLRAVDWIREAARRLRRGFMILIDYGHEARELYSPTHSAGTLTSFNKHRGSGPEAAAFDQPEWLRHPGEQDLTAHVDFTSLRAAAEAESLTTLGFLDQTYFLMGLLDGLPDPPSAIRNPQFKTLMLPGGIGSTHKVLLLGKGVGAPALRGCSFRVRVT